MTIKKILTAVFAVVLVCGLIGLCVGLSIAFGKKDKTQSPSVPNKCEHAIKDGVCELCGKKVADISWSLDIVTKDCNIKFFINDDKKYESFGVGVNGYTVNGVLDSQTVIATSVLSDTTRINVYKCTYSNSGKFTGYPVDEETTLFEGKKYDKQLVATLKATSPVYEIVSDKDCLYIFEKI